MRRSSLMLAVAAVSLVPVKTAVPQPGTGARALVSAPITNVRYELTFDSATAADRTVKVVMTFDVAGAQPVLLSWPSWTPGAYEVSNFARKVSHFAATQNGQPRRWDKADYDTWRIRPQGAGAVTGCVSSGRTSAWTSVQPISAPTRRATDHLSPVTIDRLRMLSARNSSIAARASGLVRSSSPIQPRHFPPRAT